MEAMTVILDDGTRHEVPFDDLGRGTLADFLAAHGFPLNTRCGKRGICNGCEVAVGEADGAEMNVEKACQRPGAGAKLVKIPARSRMEHRPQVSETFRIDIPVAHQPLFEAGSGGDTAVAIDLGTTTVVVMLVDLGSGEVLGTAGGFNEQIRFGDNVLTRIDIGSDPEVRRQMQEAVTAGTIVPLILKACDRAGRSPERLAGGVIAGNTTMLHLLVGEDPKPLGIAPFTPAFVEGRRMTSGEIGITIPGAGDRMPIQLLPGIAAFIGADIVAGIYATGMRYDDKPSLLVDIGTNGEIVLQHEGRLTTCATAAGPAFEGGGLRFGTRARDGAISRLDLSIDPFRVDADVIGGGPLAVAAGICGSAYIDFLAEAREEGLLTMSGRFEESAWESIPASHRIIEDDERALRLAGPNGNGDARVSEVDVAVLLQAKAAIGAGIDTLLEIAGAKAAEIGRVYLAGGFGMHLDVEHAIEIGLLPGFTADQVEVVGNTSLAGALLGLIDRGTLDEMEEIRDGAEVVELNLHEGFEDCYIDHLMLP
jgi:uncharacterized 2Fe-2S/4Fe-4S cluster protein (DUF4445 family)